MTQRILVVDDEKDIVDLLVYNLEKEGYAVSRAYDGQAALRKIFEGKPDLVILDLMLPGVDGLNVCKRLRAHPETMGIPVLMLSAKGAESDKIVGLELGADDYMTKPFSPRELVARVKALLRRDQGDSPSRDKPLKFEELEIDPGRHEVRIKGKDIAPTALEFKLLYYLARHPGRVATREILLEQIWNVESNMETRTVDVHVRRLRQKLGNAGRRLQTVRGVGYKFGDGER